MLFLDGVGIGKHDPSINPFFAARLPALSWLLGGMLPSLRHQHLSSRHATVVPLDATMGVEGLPQSGTGQTALFTGMNGAKIIGKHFGPYPYSTLRPVIAEHNIFKRLVDADKRPYFANAFPQRFFDYFEQRKNRMTVTTLSYLLSGHELLKADDLFAGRGVSADITNQGWAALGYPALAIIQPEEAGRRLAELTRESDFVLFEYWKTDKAGHSRELKQAIEVLELFDAMLAGIIQHLDLRKAILVVVSDHGNIEDLSTKAHTRHPIPAIIHGRDHGRIAAHLHPPGNGPAAMLTAVTPAVLEVITRHPPH